jgi:hypothetical protein
LLLVQSQSSGIVRRDFALGGSSNGNGLQDSSAFRLSSQL